MNRYEVVGLELACSLLTINFETASPKLLCLLRSTSRRLAIDYRVVLTIVAFSQSSELPWKMRSVELD